MFVNQYLRARDMSDYVAFRRRKRNT